MSHVFISYNHNDGDFADVLARGIEKAGFDTWVDEDRMYAGDNWREEIDQAIRDAFALIVVMTPDAKASEYVTYEWAFALGLGMRVIPVLRKSTEKPHPRLDLLRYEDFTTDDRKARPWDALIRALRKAVEERAPITVRVPHDAPSVVKQAVAALDSANPTERRVAIDSLAQTDHPAALEALAGAVQHPVQDVRIHASFTLAEKFEDARAVPGLLEALRDDEAGVRRQAARALGQAGDPTAVPGLLDALRDRTREVREATARALGQIGDPAAVPGLLDALRDEDAGVRQRAAEALGQIGDAAAVPGLLEALRDKGVWVRETAADALGQIGDPTAVPGLVEALNDESWGVRRAAASALERIGTPEALAAVEEWRSSQ